MKNIKDNFNRIRGYYKNPRFISQEGLGDLGLWLKQFGDLGVMTIDVNTWEVVSGNQRNKVIHLNEADFVDVDIFDEMGPAGTVGWAYVLHEGERFPVRFVQWSPEQVEQAVIIANKAGGFWNMDKLLDEFDNDLLLKSGWDESELIGIFDDDDEEDDSDEDTSINDNDDEPVYSVVFYFNSEGELQDGLLACEEKLDEVDIHFTRQIVQK
jgi:hypothetical protein